MKESEKAELIQIGILIIVGIILYTLFKSGGYI